MTKAKDKKEPARVRHGKAAAREAIGKLLGDDAAVRGARKEQEAASKAAAREKKEQE
jgi:hypothetical protein